MATRSRSKKSSGSKRSSKKSSKKAASTKRAGAKKAAAATMSSARGFADTMTRHAGAAAAGRAQKGISLNLAVATRGLAAGPGGLDAGLAFDRPRPAQTRYPIPMEEFEALKNRAETMRARVAKPESTLVADRPRPGGAVARGAAIDTPGSPVSMEPSAAPVSMTSFGGITATGWLPPDCTLATGPAHVLLSVNASVGIYNKTGGAPLKLVTLTNWFSNAISGAKIFDPKAVYDQHAGRWLLLAVALGPGSTDSFFLLSISKTSDPMGQWWNYKLNAKVDGGVATNNWADYPGLGVDAQGVYITANMFAFNGGFAYSKIRVIPKTNPYNGGLLNYFDFVNMKNADGSTAFTIQPCHTYGAPGSEYLVNSVYPSATGTQNKLTLWRIVNPSSPSMTKMTITTSPYSLPPDAAQKGGGTPLDTGDIRVLNAVFRGGSVWCALTTAHNWGAGNAASCHWFQLNATNGTLIQQGIYGGSGFHYFYPAVAPDSNGNMVMVFSRCGSTEYASIRYTGRKAGEPLGTLQGSALLKAGTANYTGLDGYGRNRWGDYAGIGNDPADTLKTWIYSMYASGATQWNTHVGATKF